MQKTLKWKKYMSILRLRKLKQQMHYFLPMWLAKILNSIIYSIGETGESKLFQIMAGGNM